MHTFTERRTFGRIEGRLGVRYRQGESDREHYTRTINVSGGGMKIELLERINPGTVLDIEMYNDLGISSRCRGEVMWIKTRGAGSISFEAGIRFIGLNLLFIGDLINDLMLRKVFAAV